jgi:hypothetical protein
MARFCITGTATNNVNKTILGLSGSAAVQPKIYHLILGPNSAPTDSFADYALRRYTSPGTSTAVTPQPIRQPSPASVSAAGQAHTVEPTYTSGADLLAFSIYSRATFQFQTDPEYGLEPSVAANNGLGLLVTAVGSTQSVRATVYFQE